MNSGEKSPQPLTPMERLLGAVMGNVPAVDTLLMGTPRDVEQQAARCARTAGPGGRYILGADCTSPRDTPAENMAAMFRAARSSCMGRIRTLPVSLCSIAPLH